MLFQAAEKKVEAMFMSIMRKGILDIPLMVLFNHLWPLYGVAASTPIVEGLSAVVAVILAIVFFKKLFRSSGNASPDRESEQPSVPS
jgi:Na+-driven multidrug efflux pump